MVLGYMMILRPACAVWSPFSGQNRQQATNRQKEKTLIIRNDKLATRVLTLSSTQVLLGNWNVLLQLLIFRKMGVGVRKRMRKPVPLVPQ